MSIIYEALKKVESQKDSPFPERTPVNINLPIQKKEKKTAPDKKIFTLFLTLLLTAIGAFLLYSNLTKQKEEKKINPAGAYNAQEIKKQAFGGIILKEKPAHGYVLEGIIYDGDASLAIINGKVVKKTDMLGSFRIDKISKDKVEMINTEDNSKVTLSLTY